MNEMKIEKINVINEGYVHCNSCFYSSQDSLSSEIKYCFSTGINRLYGEIDSGVWAISYLLSMYEYRPNDFVLFRQPEAVVDDTVLSLNDLSQYSCYLDKLYPLFSTEDSVRDLLLKGLRESGSEHTADDIKELFYIDEKRFERPIKECGNEMFRAMAAIGYAYGKQVFCFPWLSQKRLNGYHANITGLLDILESLKKIIILPIGISCYIVDGDNSID